MEAQASLTPEQQKEKTREQVASDLLLLQQKFAVAADNGVDDLGERVKQIVTSQLDSGSKKHAESLIEMLEVVQEYEIFKIKRHINSIIKGLPAYDAPEEEQKANDDLLQYIRLSGGAIRDRAHALREWYNGFEQELNRRVTAAAHSTVEVLDGIRDLGLQEIGKRWAWMDYVTYKDWEKYHALRKQFDEWREEVFLAGVQHETVEEAKAIANDLLGRGMAVAEDAAKELVRLKEVGRWKIQAREVSEDFETRSEAPPPLPKPEEETETESGTEAPPPLPKPEEETVEGTESGTEAPPPLSIAEKSLEEVLAKVLSQEISVSEVCSSAFAITRFSTITSVKLGTDSWYIVKETTYSSLKSY